MNRTIISFFLPIVLFIKPVVSPALDALPEFGTTASGALSIADEQALGKEIMFDIRRNLPISNDPLANEYIQELGEKLSQHVDHRPFMFHFFIVAAPSINAFALPGGYIGVHSGLILAAQQENELAGVLAHEISHVSQRHIAQMFQHMQQMRLPAIATMLAAIAVAIQNPGVGSSAIAATAAGLQQIGINFTRENEREADRLGIDLLARAGFDPRGMPRFFAKMREGMRYNAKSSFDFLRTHPVTNERIADTLSRANQMLDSQAGREDSQNFQLIKMRIKIATSRNKSELRQTLQLLREKAPVTKSFALDYGYTLLLLQDGQLSKARKIVQTLIQRDENQWYYPLLLAKIDTQAGHLTQAEKTLNQLNRKRKHNVAIGLALTSVYMQQSRYAKARQLLNRLSHYHPHSPEILERLIEAAGKSGKKIQAFIAKSQLLSLFGDYRGAMRQVNIALKRQGLSAYEKASLKAKREELKLLIQERETIN